MSLCERLGCAPPRPAHSHHRPRSRLRSHMTEHSYISKILGRGELRYNSAEQELNGEGWWGVIHTLQIHWNSVQVPHFYPPWQPEILTAAAQNDKINKNSWTVDQKMINWQFLFFGKFYLIYFINTGEKVQIDNGTPGFGFQVAAGRTHKKIRKTDHNSVLSNFFFYVNFPFNKPAKYIFLYLNNKSALEGSLSFLLIFKFCFV